MSDDYLKALAKIFKSTNDEAKRQGIITDYKILAGDAATQQDYDILLMVEYPNMAALDGLRDKTDPIGAKMVGTEDQQRQLAVKRLEIRDIMGDHARDHAEIIPSRDGAAFLETQEGGPARFRRTAQGRLASFPWATVAPRAAFAFSDLCPLVRSSAFQFLAGKLSIRSRASTAYD